MNHRTEAQVPAVMRRHGRPFIGLAVVLCGSLAWAQTQPPGPAPTEGPRLVATVHEVPAETICIRVPVNKSMMIDLNQPIVRAAIVQSDIAEVQVLSPVQVLVTGKSFGSTQLLLWTEDGRQVPFDVNVEMTMTQLEDIIRQIVPRARVKVSAVLDTLVLTGTVPDATSAERIVDLAGIYSTKVKNQLHVAGVQQVLIRCTVAEVNRRALRILGVNGWLAGQNVRDAFFINQIDGINPSNIGAAANANVLLPVPILTGEAGIPVQPSPTNFSIGFPRVQMQLFMQALRENGLLRVLAEPNLVAITGEEAGFLAGGEFPVPIPQDQGVVTIEWREFGVVLNFTPTVLGGQIIRLDVAPEVSELDFTNAVTFGGYLIPALTKRNVETTVEVGNGQTFAIAGLLSDQIRGVSRKIPGLGDLPVLGALFSSVNYQRSTTELVFLITPELIGPLDPEQVPSIPGEEITEPNDFELFALGLVEGPSRRLRSMEEVVMEAGCTELPSLEERFSSDQRFQEPGRGRSLWIRGPWGPAESEEG